jgi:hypothetical protein
VPFREYHDARIGQARRQVPILLDHSSGALASDSEKGAS